MTRAQTLTSETPAELVRLTASYGSACLRLARLLKVENSQQDNRHAYLMSVVERARYKEKIGTQK